MKKSQLEHTLKFWKEPQIGATVDSIHMMTDINCLFDVFSATFACGHRVEELTVAHINLILKCVCDLLTQSKL